MKQTHCIFLCIIFFLFACNQNNKQAAINTKQEFVPALLMNADTIKPPIQLQAGAPTIINVPTKPGSFYTKKKKGGTELNINLMPPALKQLDTLLAQGNSNFTTYTTDNGLALDGITSACIDKMGNLWFGTQGGGVSRYDGKSFVNFTTAQGLANNVVWSLTEDKRGNLWFGTQGGGVSRYDGKSFVNFTTTQGLANNSVRSIAEDKRGNIWFGTDGGGVSRYDGRSFVNYTTTQGLANNFVVSITEDKRGNIWFGTDGGGVSRYDGKSFVNYTTVQGLANNAVLSITIDKMGNLWFGTYGGGLSKYDGKSFINFTTAQGLVNNIVLSITEDKWGNLWFGTYGGGLSKYDGKSFVNFTTAQGLANNIVLSITEDKMGNLWFGTYGGGLSKYDGKSFVNFTTAQGLANNIVLSITKDKRGNLWFGTNGGGASKYDGKSFINFTTAQGLADNLVLSITEDKRGNLWFGTNGGGASKYDGKSFVNFTTAQGLVNNIVLSITEDKRGNLWFGTGGGGASKYDGKFFVNYTTAQGLANNSVMSITEDKRGNIWFGTDGGGVSRYDGKSFINFTTAQGLANNSVLSITEDKRGNIWFGTLEGLSFLGEGEQVEGLQKKNKKVKFITYTTANSLPDNCVTQVVEANDGKLYIGTNLGICELLPPLKGAAEGQEMYKVGLIYNSARGYPIKDVNAGQGTMYKDSKGIMWIATGADKTALVRFDESAVNKNTAAPTVVLQSLKINKETICWYNLSENDSTTKIQQEVITFGKVLTKELRDTLKIKFNNIKFDGITKFYPMPQNLVLPYNHNNVTINFVAIETGKNFLCRYQYMLEGYDKGWSPVTEKTEATFGNIYEGDYTFKLKAMSPFGVWSEPIAYNFTVLPPWWRTWWMYSLYAAVFVIVIGGFVKWREKKIKKEKEILEEKVELRTVQLAEKTKVAEEQKHLIEEKHKEIIDSINYAERIQHALLASKKLLDENLSQTLSKGKGAEPDYFILFKPKHVVSGDFYWATKLSNNQFVLVTADSTGHGVPGAIMSILNIACLKEASLQGITSPELLLNETRRLVIENLKNDGSAEGGKDGMDASLLSFDFKNNLLQCACANNPVWIVRGETLIEIKPDKMPIGKHDKDNTTFTLQTQTLQKGDLIYTLTDGFADQFGGAHGKKFKYKQLQALLLSVAQEPMEIQKQKLNDVFDNWRGNLEQVDDVCLIGIRL